MTQSKIYSYLNSFLFFCFVVITITFFVKMGDLNQLDIVREFSVTMKESKNHEFLLYATLFFIITIVLAALPFPGISMSALLSGAVFGFLPGAFISSVGIALGNTIAFMVIRKWFRQKVQTKYAKELVVFNQVTDRHGVMGLFSLRAVLVIPSFMLNAVAALSKIELHHFIIMTFLGRLPLSICYAFAGRELMAIKSLDEILTPYHITIFLVIALFPWLFKYIVKRVMP